MASSDANWFAQNAPPITADQVAQLYQQYLGRAPENDQVVQQYITGIGSQYGLSGIASAIASSPEAQTYASSSVAARQARGDPSAAAPTAASGPPSGGNLSDPAYAAKLVAYYGAQPGADPSLTNDPNYWIGKITSGELGPDQGYIVNKMQTAWQQPAVGSTPSAQAPAPSALAQYVNPPPTTTFTPPPAPTYTAYNPGAAPTPTTYTMPTEAQAQATPGYQFAVDQGNLGLQRSAAAQGGLLSGGALKDISAYNVGMADQNYNNLVSQGLAINQQNNTNALNQYQATVNANLGAGSLNLSGVNQQFQNTYTPSWNAYLSSIGQGQYGSSLAVNQNQFNASLANNQSQFGANYGLTAQNQYWGQGLAENQNAYNQWSNNQSTAFNQNYATAQLGNPGNPYA
jgi:hypothetical protein